MRDFALNATTLDIKLTLLGDEVRGCHGWARRGSTAPEGQCVIVNGSEGQLLVPESFEIGVLATVHTFLLREAPIRYGSLLHTL